MYVLYIHIVHTCTSSTYIHTLHTLHVHYMYITCTCMLYIHTYIYIYICIQWNSWCPRHSLLLISRKVLSASPIPWRWPEGFLACLFWDDKIIEILCVTYKSWHLMDLLISQPHRYHWTQFLNHKKAEIHVVISFGDKLLPFSSHFEIS